MGLGKKITALLYPGYCHSGSKSINTKWVRLRYGLIQLTMSSLTCHAFAYYQKESERERKFTHTCYICGRKMQLMSFNVLFIEMNACKRVIVINANKSCSIWALLTIWAGKFFAGEGAVLYIIGCVAASLTSTYKMPTAPPLVTTTKMSPNTVKCPERQNYSQVRTIQIIYWNEDF